MLGAIVVIFIIAYAAIALEHPIKINKGCFGIARGRIALDRVRRFGGDHALVEPQLRSRSVPPLGSYSFSSEP